jgi:hypothetical protein
MLGSPEGVRGKVEQLVDSITLASSITIQERRSAQGLDAQAEPKMHIQLANGAPR